MTELKNESNQLDNGSVDLTNKRKIKYKKKLKKTFGFDCFRPNQFEIVDSILYHKKDVCAIMPTGFGKSLCYQFPAIFSKKVAVIISPLISLMEDQKIQLQELNISVCCLNSSEQNSYDIINEIIDGEYCIVYMTPEYAVNAEYLFTELVENDMLCLVAIDEGHCVSLWGHSFRDSYTELYKLKDYIDNIPIMVLTATATDNVLNDIETILKLNNPVIIKSSFDRPNLYIDIKLKTDKTEKHLAPLLLDKYGKPLNESIIIYCLTRNETEKTAEIVQKMGVPCKAYHAGFPPEKRSKIHHKFINNKINCIAATIAFGMGINKSNIRKVIHMNASKDMESYYQEIGRAGRDGKASYCYAFYKYGDFKTHRYFLEDIENSKFKKYRSDMITKMQNFVQSDKCRRVVLLDYFDEDYGKEKCNNCDNCLNDTIEKKDMTNEAKMLLGIAKDTYGKFGLTMLILILRGSKAKKIPYKYYKNRWYGKGCHYSEAIWKKLANKMIHEGYLQEIKTGSFGYTIARTKLGESWINLIDCDKSLEKIFVNIDDKKMKLYYK
jgi:Werner syndrome ATP-dependent helicase